jgi:tryptophanase
MSSAVFHRLSQPREPVRWSKVALITNDMFSVAEARNQNNKGTANTETKDQTQQPGNSYKYKSYIDISSLLQMNLVTGMRTMSL